MPPQNDVPDRSKFLRRRIRHVAFVVIAVAAVIVGNGLLVRQNAQTEAQTLSVEQSIPVVSLIRPAPSEGGNSLTLPGNLQAYYTAPIFARVAGYVKSWNKDIGARVHKGELLAEIDTPDVDQQVEQARADLANAQAAYKQSQSTAERWANLLRIGAVSKQDAEEKSSDLEVKGAVVKSSQANLDRLLTTKTFARIVAPFDGVVTERTVDIGNLVNAGAGGGGSQLFTVSDIHKMRVYVRVPQNYSAQIREGLHAKLSLPEYPGQTFSAQLVSTSDSISNQSNTLLVQLDAENADGRLKAGSYAQVSFDLPASAQSLSLPVSALLFRADGLTVATVDDKDRVLLKPINISSDLGTTVEINSGLTPSDRVIDSPPDSLRSGDIVRIASEAKR
jgi:RND family efflux transporter MFP subunit